MLDLQRKMYDKGNTGDSVVFTRRLVLGHQIAGILALTLLSLHECFAPAAWVGGWYVASLGLIAITSRQQAWARFFVALSFAAGAVFGFYGLIWLFPAYRPAEDPVLPLTFLPLWVTLLSLGYGGVAYLWAVSQRVKRASEQGFDSRSTPANF
jgi:hypothetical protein